MFEFEENPHSGARIRVIGVGGGGGNAISTMITSKLRGVDFIVSNTDKQALLAAPTDNRIQLGVELTKGLGAGADPDVGRNAALEDYAKLVDVLSGSDLVFITAGMGGGTGTGGAPVVADAAKEVGALTVGVVTKPFFFEGKKRMKQAQRGLDELRESVDTLIVIPNQKLVSLAEQDMSIVEAFKKADEVLLKAVQGISDLVNIRGHINLDFADVRTIMSNKGLALMGTGIATGSNRAVEAANMAISSPLLEDIAIDGAMGIIINITGGPNLTLHEVNAASSLIHDAAHEDADIIFGQVIDPSLKDEVRVTVIATGFTGADARKAASVASIPVVQAQDFILKQREIKPEPRPEVKSEVKKDIPQMVRKKRDEDLEQAKKIAKELGLSDEEYDIPTFIRKQTTDA
ncbi:MAG: cell division protein FtsZ [Deltaproteobacteria bacterium]|nr:cell division protein FtsZ [Deltaproteobacteria bacterium]